MSLRFNTFRAKRYLRSKFVEGKYLLASEASDIELEVLDVLRRVVKDTIGDVALEDAWKVELLSSTQLLIKPGEAWFSGLPFQFRSGKDQLVSGAVLSAGVTPVGVVITDDATGLGKIITLNSGSTTPTNNYRIVITAKEELLTEVEDPFLQNANLTESTAQKVRLKFQINLVPESLQTESPIPYRDESSTSLVVTNFPASGSFSSPNLVNQIVVTPIAAGNGELVNLQLITGSEKIDGRDVEITLRNDSTIGGGHPIPKSPTEQAAFENGKLVDSNGSIYHVNAIFNDVVSTQVVIRLDKEPNQPNPEIVNTKPFTLIKRDVYATDGVNGQPQGKLFWNIAKVDWHSTNLLVHESKVLDLRTSVSKLADLEMQLLKRDNLALLGGGNVSFDLNNSVLNWPTAFKIMNPHGLSQTIAANSVVLADGGSLAYEMNLVSGGTIARGNLAISVSSAGATSTLAAVSLSDVRLGNIVKDSGGIIATITAIDDSANTITTSPALVNTGAATIYKDSFGASTAPLTKNTFILAVRDGDETLIGSDDAEENTFEDRNLKLVRGGTWDWGGSSPGNLAVNSNGMTSTHFTMGTNIWYGQKFTTTSAGNLTTGTMYLKGTSSPTGSIVLKIFSDAAGLPGTLLGTSASVNAASLYSGGLPYAAQVFTFAPIALSNATVYHAVLDVSGWTSGTLEYEGTPTDTYASGNVVKSIDTGSTYSAFTGEDLKLSIDGTISGGSGVLTWSSDAFIQVPGLPEARNKIAAGNISIPTDGDVAYVNINRFPGANATLSVSVAAISSLISTEDLLIIARRLGTDVIVGTHSTRLKAGQSTELDAQASNQSLSFTGQSDSADGSPNYSGNTYVVDGTSLETAIGALDTALAGVSGVVTAIQWKAPVANFAALPASGNTDGDARMTLDTRLIYTWKSTGTVWVQTGTFKAPVATFASLPATDNVDGDIRIVLDTRLMYSWVNSLTLWIPVSGSGGSVKATFLDPVSTLLPTGLSATFDGVVAVNGDLVLFTNLSSGNNKVYKLSGVGVALAWSAELLFNGSSSPSNGDSVRVLKGNAFSQQLAIFNGTGFRVNDVVRYFDGASGDFWEQSSIKTTTLADNTTGNIYTVAKVGSENMVINYSLIRGSLKETGQLLLTHDSTNTALTRTTSYLGSSGVTFTAQISGANLLLDYATTNLGSSATMKYFVSRWSDSAGGPTGIPSYSGGGGGGGAAAGANTDIQYNNAGVLAADSRFQWDSANGALDLNDMQFVVLSSGITLNDNQVAPATVFSYNASNFRYAIIEYSCIRNGQFRVGRMLVSNNGSTTGFSDDFVETASTGLNFNASISGANVIIDYTSTSTGFTSTFKYTVRRWN